MNYQLDDMRTVLEIMNNIEDGHILFEPQDEEHLLRFHYLGFDFITWLSIGHVLGDNIIIARGFGGCLKTTFTTLSNFETVIGNTISAIGWGDELPMEDVDVNIVNQI